MQLASGRARQLPPDGPRKMRRDLEAFWERIASRQCGGGWASATPVRSVVTFPRKGVPYGPVTLARP